MEKINQTIKTNLFSTNTATVVSAIEEIKQKGNKLYLPILFDLLNSNPESEVETEIKSLLATVKDKESVSVFMHVFEERKYRPIWKKVLTTCWQNGLDFSDYTATITQLVIHEDWEIAFEAFTIIDNFEFLPDEKTIAETRDIIAKALETADDQKTYFLQEILTKLS